MVVDAPPRPPSRDRPAQDEHEALIEEARRRARRRRQRHAALVLVAATGAAAFLGFHHGGGGPRKPVSADASSYGAAISNAHISVAPVERSGQLTIVGLPSRSGQGPPGWYALSTVAQGRLHPFLRCPRGAGWCGDVLSVDWSPDGGRVAFSVTSFGGTAAFDGVHVVDVGTGEDRWRLTTAEPGDPVDLAWSPDGSKLAFASAGSIYVMDAADFNEWPLPLRGGELDSSPSWSPDGRRLVFAVGRNKNSSIYVGDLDGSHLRRLAGGASAPSWSPDGTKIAYRSSCGGIRLITPSGSDMTPAGSTARCATVGVTGSPVWTPDGKRIAIVAHMGPVLSQRSGTYVMNADGGNLALLTSADGRAVTGAADASWQP